MPTWKFSTARKSGYFLKFTTFRNVRLVDEAREGFEVVVLQLRSELKLDSRVLLLSKLTGSLLL